jgi:hypothetical protein
VGETERKATNSNFDKKIENKHELYLKKCSDTKIRQTEKLSCKRHCAERR